MAASERALTSEGMVQHDAPREFITLIGGAAIPSGFFAQVL
jgi:hypothetical protein